MNTRYKPSKFLWAAIVLCVLVLIAHELLGAPMVLPPLSAADLAADVIWLHHFSWHVGSIAIIAMIALFILATKKPENLLMATVATAMSVGFALLGLSLAIVGDKALWGTPAPYAWCIVAILGSLGILRTR
ncbi:hypothetical protein [Zhongshania sp. BJYM1]|jgi:hypothetical protein|uniref:hypothetical protein n=1 Tax=Zhongshania aquatica TaxID=2965069 RepID=UPI0022B34CEC|nr:hypothetical protein [Marortus sp. BJYM1]